MDTPEPPLPHTLTAAEAAERLLAGISAIGPLAVAYSGGADSALVLAAAAKALGPRRVLALTAVSESLAGSELAPAHALANSLGVRHLTPRTHELSRPGYRANGTDRCYFCKSEVLDTISAVAAEHGYTQIATGTNADDTRDPYRPGIRAGTERGIHTPLHDNGLDKTAVRAVSRYWGLPTWNKPATPCLASRIRYGVQVTPFRLARIDRAETAVRALLSRAGLDTAHLRVRDLGDGVRIEVDAHLLTPVRDLPGLTKALHTAGFTDLPVTLDAFVSGNLNRQATPQRPRPLPRRPATAPGSEPPAPGTVGERPTTGQASTPAG